MIKDINQPMKNDIHPKWFPEARVTCACGNSWTTGSTQAELRVEICSTCHPFYTGEQRIVDTEGQVDRFMKRLQALDSIRAESEAREAAKTPPDLPIANLGLQKRTVTILEENGIKTVADVFARLDEGEESLLELPNIGRKILADTKKSLRTRGYDVPMAAETAETAEAEE
jgi:large subunit ribosomal protein L31